MEGISKEKIQELKWKWNINHEVFEHLLDECTELDPWLPIESAPLRKEIRLYSREEGQIASQLFDEEDRKYFTHWREATEDPKE